MSERLLISDEDMAGYFLEANHTAPGTSAIDVVQRVESWLSRSDMSHRSAFSIAVAVEKRVREPAPAPMPTLEQAAFEHAQAEGYGDNQPLTPEDIAALDMAAFAKLRAQLGLGKRDEGLFTGLR